MEELAPIIEKALLPTAIITITGGILSVVVDFWPAFTELSPKKKRLVFWLLCLLPSFGGYLLLAAMGMLPWNINLVWLSLAAWAGAVIGGTAIHTRELPNE